ncbi:hypothetical protein CC86DRAFT_401419 [Ophiobolus disseminans]|uniref:F-box domain-containing protein n=1 Tax=Ophiobolus disseminans TaxID=1469910 RepID=A0A6A7AJ28_9PLEO|nr:hypothetical protein CC86DRAFT_401419 [Ophiobolus disseminans]
MDRLPRELVDNICSFMLKEDLKNVLTLNDKFRHAAERYSEAFADYTIDEDNSQKFIALYSGRRLPYLREVRFKPTIPLLVYDYEKHSCRGSLGELRQRHESFTRQIAYLFTILKKVED